MTLKIENEESKPPTGAPAEFKERIKAHAETIPLTSRSLYLKCTESAVSPRQAIKAKCQSCTGYEDRVDRIRNCTVYRCPIWTYRPYQTEDSESDV